MEPEPQEPELFALAEPEQPVFGSGPYIWNDKVKKVKKKKKRDDNFLGNTASSDIKKGKILIRIWNRNWNFSEVGIGTGINKFGFPLLD